jgi:hypothetical protein
MLVSLLHGIVAREPACRNPQFASPNGTQEVIRLFFNGAVK